MKSDVPIGRSGRQSIAAQASGSNGDGTGGANANTFAKPPNGTAGSSRKESRRRLEKELQVAARHRQQAAADVYYHNPPKLEDIWICEFCEYERIFGEPPRALIRDYEIKDRRHRKEEADRKRLLEKAKAKSRKGKKSKAPAKDGQAASNGLNQPLANGLDDSTTPPMDQDQDHGHSTQSEDDCECHHYGGCCSEPAPPPREYLHRHGPIDVQGDSLPRRSNI